MREPASAIDARLKWGLCLLAGVAGYGLSVAAFEVSLLVVDAIHRPASRAYFGTLVSITDEEILEARIKAVLGVLSYFSALVLCLWVTGRLPPSLRGPLRLCLAIPAWPGALLGLVAIVLGAIFVKGVV